MINQNNIAKLNLSIIVYTAEIVIAPETQHHLLNDNERATFFCQAVGDTAYWLVNGNTVDGLGNDDLKGNGWIFSEIYIADPHNQRNNVFNLTLEIPPAIGNNNTEIRCVATQHSPAFSDPVLLIIKGMLSVVTCLCCEYVNNCSFVKVFTLSVITWDTFDHRCYACYIIII